LPLCKFYIADTGERFAEEESFSRYSGAGGIAIGKIAGTMPRTNLKDRPARCWTIELEFVSNSKAALDFLNIKSRDADWLTSQTSGNAE